MLPWFEYSMSPTNWECWRLHPQYKVQRQVLGRVVNSTGSDLISGVIHPWIHNLVTFLRDSGNQEMGPNWKSRSLGACPWSICLPQIPPLLFASKRHEARSFVLSCTLCQDAQSQDVGGKQPPATALKPWAQWAAFPLSCPPSYFHAGDKYSHRLCLALNDF